MVCFSSSSSSVDLATQTVPLRRVLRVTLRLPRLRQLRLQLRRPLPEDPPQLLRLTLQLLLRQRLEPLAISLISSTMGWSFFTSRSWRSPKMAVMTCSSGPYTHPRAAHGRSTRRTLREPPLFDGGPRPRASRGSRACARVRVWSGSVGRKCWRRRDLRGQNSRRGDRPCSRSASPARFADGRVPGRARARARAHLGRRVYLRVGCDVQDPDHPAFRTMVPEHPPGAGGSVLDIGLEHLLPRWAREREEHSCVSSPG
jgi:hypothetical protein